MKRLVPLLLVGCLFSCTKPPAEGVIQLRVVSTGFRPGCVRVVAADDANLSLTQTVDMPLEREKAETVFVAVFRPKDWSEQISLSAFAFERECTATPVARKEGDVLRFSPNELRKHTISLSAPDVDADGFVAVAQGGTDCDDAKAEVNPAQVEACDGFDNNCDGKVDDIKGVGLTCLTPNGCPGTSVCDASGVRCNSAVMPTEWFLDDDQDGHGSPAGSVLSCGAPSPQYVTSRDDCDDGDPYSFPGNAEICDDKDNDCNGVNGDLATGGACPGANWKARTDTGSGEWNTVASPRAGEVLIAGPGNRTGNRPINSAFLLSITLCPTTPNAVWTASAAAPGSTAIYLGSATGQLAVASTSSAIGCVVSNTLAPGGSVAGLVVFNVSGSSQAFGISSAGQLFRYAGPNNVEPLAALTNVRIFDLAGSSPSNLIAVGQSTTTNLPFVARFDGAAWTEIATNASAGALRGVSVVNPRLAFAVGDNGLVLRLQGGTATRQPAPEGANFTSVLAFGANAIYATDGANVRRFNQTGWNTLTQAGAQVTLRKLAGSTPADIWAVGSNGAVLHWREP